MNDTLTQQALQTFEKNIAYFQNKQTKVFSKLSAFDTALNNSYYTPKYEITIENEMYYDVVELSTDTKLYNADSFEYAKQVSQSINFEKEENVYKTFKKHPLNIPETKDISPILSFIQTKLPGLQKFKKIEKFILFGIGLGTHFQTIHTKLQASTYFIVEDDIELFRLSLFVTPYYKIAKEAELFFSIFEDTKEFKSSAQKFLNFHFYQNQYIKFFEMLQNDGVKVKEFHIQVVSQSQNLFFYNTILSQYIEPLQLVNENYNFLNLLAKYKDSPLHSNPVLLLAAGPSLQKNIDLIKINQEKFFIVALSSVLNILQNNNIVPDIVTHMDGFETSTQHFRKLHSLEFLKNTLFFFSARSPRYILELFDKKQIFLYENGTNYKSSMGNLSAACVGSTSYLLLLALGVKELYLIGLDLALDQKSGMTHSEAHEYVQKLDLESDNNSDTVAFKKEVVQTLGNFTKSVYTTVEFQLSIDSINAASIGFKKENQKVYNLNDGAKFINTEPLRPAEFKKTVFKEIEKTTLKKRLFGAITEEASQGFDTQEKALLKFKKEHITQLLLLIKTQESEEFTSSSNFFNSLVMLFEQTSQNTDKNIYDISLILQEFFKYIYGFIYDFLNTQEIQEIQYISQINKLLSEALTNILTKYLKNLQKI